jgi:hypothetical protein
VLFPCQVVHSLRASRCGAHHWTIQLSDPSGVHAVARSDFSG